MQSSTGSVTPCRGMGYPHRCPAVKSACMVGCCSASFLRVSGPWAFIIGACTAWLLRLPPWPLSPRTDMSPAAWLSCGAASTSEFIPQLLSAASTPEFIHQLPSAPCTHLPGRCRPLLVVRRAHAAAGRRSPGVHARHRQPHRCESQRQDGALTAGGDDSGEALAVLAGLLHVRLMPFACIEQTARLLSW